VPLPGPQSYSLEKAAELRRVPAADLEAEETKAPASWDDPGLVAEHAEAEQLVGGVESEQVPPLLQRRGAKDQELHGLRLSPIGLCPPR